MTLYLQKNLPLDSTFLRDLHCLGATWRREDWTVEAIKRIASALPHIVGEREISYSRCMENASIGGYPRRLVLE